MLDAQTQPWIEDHCPTYTAPALPVMVMLDRLIDAARRESGRDVVAVDNLEVKGWAIIDSPRRFVVELQPLGSDRIEGTLKIWREAARAELSRFEPIATATMRVSSTWPRPQGDHLAALSESQDLGDVYRDGRLFHGPAFQLVRQGREGGHGASGLIDLGAGTVPVGVVHPAALDAVLHLIPHDQLSRWFGDTIGSGHVGYPRRIDDLRFFGPTPSRGQLRAEVRVDGFDGDMRHPRFRLELWQGDWLWCSMRLSEVLFPTGPLGSAPPADRQRFLRDYSYVPGLTLSMQSGGWSRLSPLDVKRSNWFKGTLEEVYATDDGVGDLHELTRAIVAKEHAARLLEVHPREVVLEGAVARHSALPWWRAELDVRPDASAGFQVRSAKIGVDTAPMREYWSQLVAMPQGWLGDDIYRALVERYVSRIVPAAPDVLEAIAGRSALYLGNHQVQIESLLVTMLASVLSGTTVVTMANAKHRERWVGWLVHGLFGHPACLDPHNIVYFDQHDHASFFELLDGLKADVRHRGASIMVHADGTRQTSCRQQAQRVSSALLDFALELALPIVPVHFAGGLPVEPLDHKLEFPLKHTHQAYHLGRPIEPDTLAALPYAERRHAVLEAINALGPDVADRYPHPADTDFSARVAAQQLTSGAGEVEATIVCLLQDLDDPGPDTQQLLRGLHQGRLHLPDTAQCRWLAEFARRLYGPRGPSVVVTPMG